MTVSPCSIRLTLAELAVPFVITGRAGLTVHTAVDADGFR